MAKKLYVGNLPYETNDQDLHALFSNAGQVESVNLMRDQATGRARGFAFVEMATDEAAQAAIQQLNNHDMGGRMHIEGPAPFTATLGNWFHIWGQPLSRDNVGGITGMPVVVYVTENGVVTRWDDDPALIELKSHQLITIQIGTQLTELPNFAWTGT